ncbi:mRNA splicing factor [Sistotremastrum suecicum HHB10207 ss-3]|uniref:mRNA splicing factor n=1 Tax=Sistotremastrum suecicum HHB10207 ss-3 TaxID=1314776 RepID=A0A166ELL5_9AGAM|nr:mRNA splicing factor [Sistotremastrum suecicum HHB10207 ss-3]
MSLVDASEQRKARLQALRAKKQGGPVTAVDGSSEPVTISQRNFDPVSRTLRKHAAAEDAIEDTVEKDVAGLAEKIIAEDEERRAQELDLFNIAPKRPHWDLKRETEKKLAKLERKTQEAIHTLIRQRLAAQRGNDGDIVGAMKAQEAADKEEDSDED